MHESPMFREDSIKKRANKAERRTAKQFGAKQQPASGAGYRKGDFTVDVKEDVLSKVRGRKFVGDLKSTQHNSLSVSVKMIDKIKSDMYDEKGDEWFIPLEIAGKLRAVVISPELFNELTNGRYL